MHCWVCWCDCVVESRQRLFVALWPDTAVRRQLWDLARGQAPAHARLTHLEDLHLTLCFLGPVAEQRIAALREALARVQGACFDLCLTHTGHWRRPQVWWCAPDEVPQPLNLLVDTLTGALESLGFARESRPFCPHVTLARKVRRVEVQALPEPIRWHVEGCALVKSTSVADPPRYRVLHTWHLGN